MILLTGGTGFLGSALLGRLSSMYPDKPIYVLVRAQDDEHAAHRVRESSPALALKNIFPIAGDVSRPNLGLSSKNSSLLKKEIKRI